MCEFDSGGLSQASVCQQKQIPVAKYASLMKDWLLLGTWHQLRTVNTQGIGRTPTENQIPDEIKKLKISNQIRIFGAVTDSFIESDKLIASRIEKTWQIQAASAAVGGAKKMSSGDQPRHHPRKQYRGRKWLRDKRFW